MPAKRIRLSNHRSISPALRARYLKLAAADARTREAEQKDTARKLAALSTAYRKKAVNAIGAKAFREYRALKKELENAPRAKRLRATQKFLDAIAFDRMRLRQLRREYFAAARLLLPDIRADLDGVFEMAPPDGSPWVEHRAPFNGVFDWTTYTKQGDVNAPSFTTSANPATGVLRSRIRARVSDAGDDDQLTAEHEAGFTTWHTTLEDGRIEGFVVFEFRQRGIHRGEISDEWGFSNAVRSQSAVARLRVYANSGPVETLDSLIFAETEPHWGDADFWNHATGNPRDLHGFYFSTTRTYPQGTPLVLEAGIHNLAWLQVDDMSIDMTNDLDLRLEKIKLRSCP